MCTRYTIVLMPINVPNNRYCWYYGDGITPGTSFSCKHFDNEGGHNTCGFGWSLWGGKTDEGQLKPEECNNLLSAGDMYSKD